MPFPRLAQMANISLDPTNGQYLDPSQDPNAPVTPLSDQLTQALSSTSAPMQSDPRSALQDLALSGNNNQLSQLANNTNQSGTLAQQANQALNGDSNTNPYYQPMQSDQDQNKMMAQRVNDALKGPLSDDGSDQPSLAQQIKDYIGKNLDKQAQNTKDMDATLTDKLKMSLNPDLQGPPQPGAFDKQTPQTQDFVNNAINAGMAIGSINSGNGGKTFNAAREASVKDMPGPKQWTTESLQQLSDVHDKIQANPNIDPAVKAKARANYNTALKNAALRGVKLPGSGE